MVRLLWSNKKYSFLALAICGVWGLAMIRMFLNLTKIFPRIQYALTGRADFAKHAMEAAPAAPHFGSSSLLTLEAVKVLKSDNGDGPDTGDMFKGMHPKHGSKPQRADDSTNKEEVKSIDIALKAATLRHAAREQLRRLVYVGDHERLFTHRRQFVMWNSALKAVVKRNFVEYKGDKDANATEYRFPAKVVDRLYDEDPGLSYATCAIVGNSGVTLLASAGSEIDEHDAVIRMNLAPVRGFEDHVGSRTTFQVVNSPNMREMLAGSLPWQTNDNATRLVMFETATAFARTHLASVLMEEYRDTALLLNPSFAEYCLQVWQTLKRSVELDTGREFHKKPMSGFFATMMALQMCDHVDLYGFDAYTGSKMKNLYHYFDHVQGFTDVHSFDLAMHIFRKIQEMGLISIQS